MYILLGTSMAGAQLVSGNVNIANGKGIRTALTVHDLSTSRVSGQSPFDRQFSSKADGTFSIPDIPAGKYEICVDAPQENVLDPCLWSLTPSAVTVPASGSVSGLQIEVNTGYMLRVHVKDPQAALQPTKGGIGGDELAIHVSAPNGRYVNFRALSLAPSEREHYLLVPFGQTLTLTISSSTLALSDGNSKRFSGDSLTVPLRIAKGGSWPEITVGVAKR
jgi:hypothetical protein